MKYTMIRYVVGRRSSIGRSLIIWAVKYDDNLYVPEDLSFASIDLSGGNAKIALNMAKKVQKLE